jgi:hypothetical protein
MEAAMKMSVLAPIALGLAFALSGLSASFGDELTAGQLYQFCKAKDEAVKMACGYYILGIVQGIGFGDGTRMVDKQFVERKKTIFCTPDNLTGGQMVAL